MEIIIRLAGVQLGPYTEEQVRQHMEEGLLAPTDSAQRVGATDWAPLSEVMAKMAPPVGAPAAETDELPELIKKPSVTPSGVTRLPTGKPEIDNEPLPSPLAGQDKKTMFLGPNAPGLVTPPTNTGSIATTSPLASGSLGTKKVARQSLKALVQKTSPLPTKPIVLPSRASAPPAPPVTGAPASSPSGPMVPPRLPSSVAPPAPAAPTAPAAEAKAPARPPVASVPSTPTPPPPGQKKAPPLPEKEAIAKTAPMRSAAPPAPHPRATMPVTTPLPTKAIFRPKTGPVPPPSVVSALTKNLEKPAPPASKAASTPEQDLADETKTELLPSAKSKDAAKSAEKEVAPPPDESADKPAEPKKPRRILPLLIYVCAVLALLTLYYVWSPYHAAASLRNALNNGDVNDLNAAIDFPSVRDSLKQQIHDQLAQANFKDANTVSMIDRSIDLYVTPEDISALIKTPDAVPPGDQGQTVSPSVAANILLNLNTQPVKSQGLASVTDFVLDRDVAMFHLEFQGLGWKLKRIDIQPNLQQLNPSDSAIPLLSPVVDTFMEQGTLKLKKSDWTGANLDFTQVLAIDPQSSLAYSQRAATRQAKGDLDGAIKDYSQALTIDPQMAAAYSGRANVKATKNDLDGAIADYSQAIHFDPTLAAAYDGRGNAKTAKEDLEGAIADFTQAISIDPSLASAYSDRGFARQANGNLDGAITDYTEALALKPKTAMAYYNRGLARQSQGNFEAAIVDFDRALAFDPNMAGAYFSRGNAKGADHDLDGAIADYTQAVTLTPKLALGYSNRGLIRQMKGDLDGAVADYTQALALDPKIATAYFNRGLIEAEKNDLDGAIADCSQALYLDPKNAQAYYTRGFAKLAKGNLDGALADLKQFCDLSPRDHNADHARLYLWLIAKAQNTKADADQELSDALENSWNSPVDDLVSKTAAFLLGRMNETDYLAASSSTDAKIDQGQRCESWYFAGMKRLLVGDKKGAIDAFHQCVATGQTDYCEFVLAKAELQGLEAPPLPPGPKPAPALAPPAAPPAPAAAP